jgi:hypothetical protein
MGHYKSNVRHIEFALFEVLGLGEKLGTGLYVDLDKQTVRDMLAQVRQLAEGPLGEFFAETDRTPPVSDVATNSVTIPEAFKKSYKALWDGEWYRMGLREEIGGVPAPPPPARWSGPSTRCCSTPTPRPSCTWPARASPRCSATAAPRSRRAGRRSASTAAGAPPWCSPSPTRAPTWAPAAPRVSRCSFVPKFHFDPESGELGERNGVFVTNVEHKMGLNASATCEVTFGATDVPAKGWLVGDLHEGIAQMFKVIEHARMMVGTKAIGTLSTCYLTALDYAKQRVQGADLTQMTDKAAPASPSPTTDRDNIGFAPQLPADGRLRPAQLVGDVSQRPPCARASQVGDPRPLVQRQVPGMPRCCSPSARSAGRTGPASPSTRHLHALSGTVPSQPPTTVGCRDGLCNLPRRSGGQTTLRHPPQ